MLIERGFGMTEFLDPREVNPAVGEEIWVPAWIYAIHEDSVSVCYDDSQTAMWSRDRLSGETVEGRVVWCVDGLV